MKRILAIVLSLIFIFGMFSMNVFAAKEESIDQLALTVTAPKEGAKPSYDKIDGRGYYSDNGLQGTSTRIFKNGIAWFKSASSYFSPGTSGTFEGNTEYTVKINLLPKGNFEFGTNITATINGKTATVETYDDGSILVVATLTSAKKEEEISQLNLSVTAPADGAKPSFDKIDGIGYYSDNGINGTSTKIYKNGIAWFKSASSYISPGTTETFKGGTEYTVKIALTPKDGYKFGASVTAKINGKTATVETFDDGSLNVSVKLTALSKEHKHTDSDWKTDKDNHWKVCTDTACGTITVAKETHKDQNKDNKCDTCGYAMPKNAETVVTPETKPTTPNPDNDTSADADKTGSESQETDVNVEQEKENDDKNSGIIIWIILGGVVILAAAGAFVFIVLKKKKTK